MHSLCCVKGRWNYVDGMGGGGGEGEVRGGGGGGGGEVDLQACH